MAQPLSFFKNLTFLKNKSVNENQTNKLDCWRHWWQTPIFSSPIIYILMLTEVTTNKQEKLKTLASDQKASTECFLCQGEHLEKNATFVKNRLQ